MTCWDILQLAPTTDVRAIKKAYAVLLKQNRPDENPDGFQRVHGAYQDALSWAENNEQPDAELTETTAAESTPTSIAETSLPLPVSALAGTDEDDEEEIPDLSEEEKWEAFLDQQWDEMVLRVETLLENAEQRNDIQAWQFLTESEALLDIDFKGAFAMRFMQRLLQLFKEQQDGTEVLLQPSLIQHLNQIFWWSERRHQYDDYVDPELLDDFMLWWQAPVANLSVLHPSVTTAAAPSIPYGNYYMRWLAMVVDCVGLFALGLLGGLLVEPHEFNAFYGVASMILGYPLFSALFEASPLQATPGKYWCHLKVCKPDLRRIGLFRALFRSLLFAVSLYFIYITVIINMLIWDGRLVHDRLTGSIVLKR